jgi:hypothetical protein
MSTLDTTPAVAQTPVANGAAASTNAPHAAPMRSAQTGRESTTLGTFGVCG